MLFFSSKEKNMQTICHLATGSLFLVASEKFYETQRHEFVLYYDGLWN